MDFSMFNEFFVVLVVLGCLGIGHMIKTATIFKKIPNNDIPMILGIIGIALNLVVSGFSMESAIYGLTMGLASVGMYEAYKNWIEGNKTK
jgi:hypothetical protein